MTAVHPALAALAPLVGTWRVEFVPRPGEAPTGIGETSVAWLEDGQFLAVRSGGDPGLGFPRATWIIGRDDQDDEYTVVYADNRGVARVYGMSFGDSVWRMWRSAPGFSQRFTGRLAPDGASIAATWEQSPDGDRWSRDFDLVYTRV